jgi:hypothetical protein
MPLLHSGRRGLTSEDPAEATIDEEGSGWYHDGVRLDWRGLSPSEETDLFAVWSQR